ncbi:MAG: aminopeptidase P family protein [Roseburia sp.]|uniref:aminopeptidase P family protein n=1 Tax=Roseburia sp. 831b TaxID=1261635 RepID=UPI0009521D91|nr:aminopeptidase P family protein [Roseburia sp. 831b]MCI5918063.1 aminopeptidase P family protein [Roseburia sp.]MDD6217040.1 aminopeptidase P family protein [Roseburia sp.]WVK73501.1 aminopeptidase P family protein [Roseburia sp. 831b]
MITERLAALRKEMAKRNISIYVVPTADFHESEYVGEHFKARKFITGFTGSAGTAVITMEEAGLWTDGRYFVQAEKQLQGSTVTLYRMGEEGVPTVNEFIEQKLKEGGTIGFDGRVVNTRWGLQLKEIAKKKNGALYVEEDLIDLIWKDRPALAKTPMFILEEKYSGKSTKTKLEELRAAMEKEGADTHILTSLYDIAWLLNVRGNDIECVPVVLSFLLLTKTDCTWFLQEEILTDEIRAYLNENHIKTRPYEEVYAAAAELPADAKVLLDRACVNYRICNNLKDSITIVDGANPTELMKAIKNPVEVDNTRAAHVKDGVAFTKFMYWLKQNIGKEKITEISASDYLEKCRREQEGLIELSFNTISAYGPNAAMMHYSATPESDAELKPEGFLLVDSGGHYYEGTTDITRTIALGPITDEMRLHFTTVCRSNLNLANAKFLYGCSGLNLDILSRGPLWQMGIDYKCGTGHGVGYLLNVHEGPNGFRWRVVPERHDNGTLEEGMITTDEPGVYLEGKYGIRTENELVCHKAEKNEYGQFMEFENITYAPIDLDAIDPDEMTGTERKLLNDYHKKVYETISPYLTAEETEWLKKYTRAI